MNEAIKEVVISRSLTGLESLIDGLSKYATKTVKKKFNEAFAINKLNFFKENVKKIGQVKTILNPDSIVHLDDIFFDEAVLFDGDYIDSFNQFSSKHVLIEGGPGQGKSLYLRKLCIKEGVAGNFIPIFIEFRNLKYSKPLRDELMAGIRELGVDIDSSLFEFLANSGKLILILDGFDEIPNNERDKIARDLENLVKTFSDLRIIISSRPDSGMGSSYFFLKQKISPMSLDIQKEFVINLYKSDKQANGVNEILSTSKFISDVTTTPLLLTLFAITYNARQFKPDSLSEFYSLIFPTMLYRHDRMKIGFERERKAKLTDYQMERLFNCISFLSLYDNNTRFSTSYFQRYLEKSAKLERLPENIEDLLIDDITTITALIVKDGYNYFAFTHKSIQEYFASVFIKLLNEDRKINFYNSVINDVDEFRKWQNALVFLETIDERNYTKYFLIPYKKKSLCLNEKSIIKINYESLMSLIGKDTKVRTNESGDIYQIYWGDTLSSILYVEYSDFAKKTIHSYLLDRKILLATYLSFCDRLDYMKFQEPDDSFVFTLDKFFKENSLQKDTSKYLSKKFESSKFKSEVINMENELRKSDNTANDILPF